MAEEAPEQTADVEDEAPPLGSWQRLYALVLGVLVIETLLFWVFTVAFE